MSLDLIPAKIRQRLAWNGDCLEWQGARDRDGYGAVRIGQHKRTVSRVVYASIHGEIPPGMLVCHRCDNPPCANPEHLFLGSYTANLLDCMSKGRRQGPPRMFGTANHRVRHEAQLVASVRSEYASGAYTQRALAEKYGVSRGTIWRWVNGKTRADAREIAA